MKIKNISRLFLTIIMGLVLSHCSTYTVKRDMTKNGEFTKTPKWYVKYDHEDTKWLYETAVSVSPDLELAVKKSVLLAKAKLADRINGKMNNRSSISKRESGQDEAMITKTKSEDKIVNIVKDTIDREYVVEKVEIYYTHHKSYRAYVKVKVSNDNIDTPMDKIRLDDKLVATIKTQEINNPISGKELNKIKAKKKAKKIKNIINNLWNSDK